MTRIQLAARAVMRASRDLRKLRHETIPSDHPDYVWEKQRWDNRVEAYEQIIAARKHRLAQEQGVK